MAPNIEVRIRRPDSPHAPKIPGVRTIRSVPLADLSRDGRRDGRRNGHDPALDLLERALVVARDIGGAAGATMTGIRQQTPASEDALRRVADATSTAVSSAGPRASSLASAISDATREVDVPEALGASVAALGEVVRGLLDELGSEGGRMADTASRGVGRVRDAAVDGATTLGSSRRPRRGTGSRLLLVAVAVGLAVPLVLVLRRRRAERARAWWRENDDMAGTVDDGEALVGRRADRQDEMASPGSGWTMEVTGETDGSPDAGAEGTTEGPLSRGAITPDAPAISGARGRADSRSRDSDATSEEGP